MTVNHSIFLMFTPFLKRFIFCWHSLNLKNVSRFKHSLGIYLRTHFVSHFDQIEFSELITDALLYYSGSWIVCVSEEEKEEKRGKEKKQTTNKHMFSFRPHWMLIMFQIPWALCVIRYAFISIQNKFCSRFGSANISTIWKVKLQNNDNNNSNNKEKTQTKNSTFKWICWSHSEKVNWADSIKRINETMSHSFPEIELDWMGGKNRRKHRSWKDLV